MERRAGAARARDGVSGALRAQLSAAQALAASRTRSADRTEAMAQVALAEGQRLKDGYSQRLAVVALIEAARNEGRHRLALDRFTDLRRLSDRAYEAEEIRTLQHLDRYDEAEAMLAKIREAQNDIDRLLPSMLYAQMWQDHNLARFDAAEAGARTLLRLADETGNYGYRLNARMVLAAVATHRGELARAAELLAPVEDDERASDEARVPRLRLMQGWLKASTGDSAGGLAILSPLLDRAEASRDPWPWSPPWMRLLVRIGLDAGNRDFARKAAELADLVAQRNPGVATLDGTALHIHGLLAEDPQALADAVRRLRESPRPLLLADALTDLGSALLKRDQPDDGVPALVEAAELYQRVGAVSSGCRVASCSRRHGIRGGPSQPRRAAAADWLVGVDGDELRVVESISAGHTNRSAAGSRRLPEHGQHPSAGGLPKAEREVARATDHRPSRALGASSTAPPSPSARDGLAVAERLLEQHDEFDVAGRRGPVGNDESSNSIERAVASVRSTVIERRPDLSTPPTGAITRAVTPSAAVAFTNLAMPARSEPASAMMPNIAPIDAAGLSEFAEAGETATFSAGLPLGAGRPRPAATSAQSSVSTLASTWSSRSLIGCS